MTESHRSWIQRFTSVAKALFWMFLLYMLLSVWFGGDELVNDRASLLDQLQTKRKSRVIAMIHRQETVSLFGVPVSNYIDIEDSEAVLRAIRLTPDDQPIDMILHTPGGLVLAASQIAKALADHKGKVTVFVPHYAMSGGTLIALAADEIVMDPNAVLGPVDPQLGDYPAASLVKLLELKKPENIEDETLVYIDMAGKALAQVNDFVTELLLKHMQEKDAKKVAALLTEGRWTHDYPISLDIARSMGLHVSTEMPQLVYQLMDLYHQADASRPSVTYIPLRRSQIAGETGS